MAETSAPETLLDTVAAATAARRQSKLPRQGAHAGHGPRYRKLGRAVRYAQADLDHWLLACSRTSTAERRLASMAALAKAGQQSLNVRP